MELGLSPDTADMNWFILPDTVNPKWIARTFPYINDGAIEGNLPCWSLAALIELMPKCVLEKSELGMYKCYSANAFDSAIDAIFDNIVWLLENGHIKTE